MNEKFIVEFFEKDNNTCPAEEFLFSLNNKMAAKMFGIIEVLEEKGNLLREPYSKHIDDGIFEIRVKVGNDIARVMYFFYVGKKIILTNGFVKKTQKTPKTEILLAKKFRKEYLDRLEGEK